MSLTDEAEMSGTGERIEKLQGLISARGLNVTFEEMAEITGLSAAKIREIATDLFLQAGDASDDDYE